MRLIFFPLVVISLGLVSLGSMAESLSFKVSPGSTAKFEAIGKPSLLKIKSQDVPLQGEIEINGAKIKGRFEVKLEDIDTGIPLRNQHMKEKYLETAQHPVALVEIESVETPASWAPGQDLPKTNFTGFLTLKGKRQAVQGQVRAQGPQMEAFAELSVRLDDYPIGIPSFMGVTLANEVKIFVQLRGLQR